MTGTPPGLPVLRERLRALRSLADAPDAELDWLLAHGTFQHHEVGASPSRKGEPVPGMYILFQGRLTHYRDQGGIPRKVVDWGAGDITGMLPYSRLDIAAGNTVVEEAIEVLFVPRDDVAAMPVTCPHVTAVLVHAMLDRAREFRTSDSLLEKQASLGRLAAGIAHEFNNPASAAARSARLLTQAQAESDAAARALGHIALTAAEQAVLDTVGAVCHGAPTARDGSPLQRADREEAITDWLRDHGVDPSLAMPLTDTDVTLEQLADLARALAGEKLGAALRWVAAGCTVRQLAREIEHATARVHELVSALKAFTYMDRGTGPEPLNVGQGLSDTLAILASKVRNKAATVSLEIAQGFPLVNGIGAELNQVWEHLIDNALDAVHEGGQVTITGSQEGGFVVVRVIDDGPGIAPDLQQRIFDPFFTTKPVGAGVGLGLDMARRFVGRHAGVITVTSEPGRTEFRVTLPVAGVSRNAGR